jgi:kynurenine formamidase
MDNVHLMLAQAIQQGQLRIVDLTYNLDEKSPFWPDGGNASPFHATTDATYENDGSFARTLQIPEHFGTHMDAPLHLVSNGASLSEIAVEKFIVPAVVVDVSVAAASSPDYVVTVEDLEQWTKTHGPAPSGCAVLIRSGWASRWPSQARYVNQDTLGVMHFPGLSVEAAHYLVERVHPVAVGIDTFSIDAGPSKDFRVHQVVMAAGLYVLENLANLERLPATGALIIALPMKLADGSGSPVRVLALVPGARSAAG